MLSAIQVGLPHDEGPREEPVSEDADSSASDAQPLFDAAPASSEPSEAERGALPPAVAMTICSVLATVTALKSLLQAHAVEIADGHLAYSTFTLTLIVEGAKFVMSVLLALTLRERSWPTAREQLLYSLPGLLYMFDNNFVFVILRYIDAATLAVLWNVKIVFTALLLRLLLSRRLRWNQWLALALLTFGVTVSNWTHLWVMLSKNHCVVDPPGALGVPPRACSHHASTADSSAYVAGFVMTLIACSIVSLANVFEEKLLKDRLETPLYCQNVVLYAWGMVFNVSALILRGVPDSNHGSTTPQPSDGTPLVWQNPFKGLDGWAAAIIATQAISGILISATFKHVSNIAALYAHAMSMVLIACFTPASANGMFIFGMAIVILSLVGFYQREVSAGYSRARSQCSRRPARTSKPGDGISPKKASPRQGSPSPSPSLSPWLTVTRVTASGATFVYREVVGSCGARGCGRSSRFGTEWASHTDLAALSDEAPGTASIR